MCVKAALSVLVLVVVLGTAGCGKDEGDRTDSSPKPGPSASATATTSGEPSATPSGTGSPTSPALGLPTDFPAQSEVPLVAGVVTSKTGGKDPRGLLGYVIEMSAVGSQKECFDRAAAALVARGFVKRGELTAQDTRQAQFTTDRWAVIISARADEENCQLGYEVGQLRK